MDLTALRVERVTITFQAAERIAHLHARRHTVVLAVALTLAGTATVAGLTGQVGTYPATALVGSASLVVVAQLRALGRLAALLDENAVESLEDLDRLISQEVEADVDAPETDA